MRALGLIFGASAICVCCVLPSYDPTDTLPGHGQAGDVASSGASSDAGKPSNTTQASGGTNRGGSNSGVGGDAGAPASGGMMSAGGKGGTAADGGDDGSGGTGGTAGSSGAGGKGGAGGSGGAGGKGGAGGNGGTGGTTNGGTGGGGGTGASSECQKWCVGAHSVVTVCAAFNLPIAINTEAKCLATCALAPVASVNCWTTHTGFAETNDKNVHCPHAEGAQGQGVCPFSSP